jgi:hypothetical protein|tara:strand:- start:661 stop:1398 length:738 start_codon:yes stop_codon:yes gene_type:complete
MAAKYLSFPVATIVDSGTETIIITGNNVTAQTATSMTDTTVNFVTLGVQVGDRVTDTANADTALVTAVTATVLTIDTDIFTVALETYSITALGSSLYDTGQNFLTTVSPGDVVYNSGTAGTARVVSIVNDSRLTLSADIMTIGDTYNVLDELTSSEVLCSLSELIMVKRDTNFATVMYYGAGSGNDIITIQHTDQGNGSLVAEAIQTAMQDAVSMPGSIPKPSSQNVPIGLNGTSRVLINDISIT